jgi:hypothetical protein
MNVKSTRLSLVIATVLLGLLAGVISAQAAELNIVPMVGGGFIELTTGATGATAAEARAKAEALPAQANIGTVITTATSTAPAVAAAPPTPVISDPDQIADASATPEQPGTSIAISPAPSPLRDAVTRGRALIAAKIQAEAAKLKKPRTVTSTDSPVNVTLAVWHAQTGEVQLVNLVKSGTKVKPDDDTDLSISVGRSNGVNSEFVVAGTDDSYVVAAQLPIYKEKWLTKKKKVYEVTDVVYSPYSSKLDTADTVAWGRDTLNGYVNDVYAELRESDVKSRAFPGRLLADVIDPDLARAIVLIEHLSPQSMQGDPTGAAESVLVTMALNQEDTYAYSRSTAGAMGLVQFIPSTYKLIAKRAELQLNPNFEQGMSDPHNAIKAEVAYLDASLADMPLSVRDLLYVNPSRVAEYLAAAYNGGDTRVRKAIATWGETWSADHSAEVASLSAQHNSLASQIKSLKAQVKKAKTATVAKKLKNDLYLAQKKYNSVTATLTADQSGTLRVETVGYVQKLRAALNYLKPVQLDATLASAS